MCLRMNLFVLLVASAMVIATADPSPEPVPEPSADPTHQKKKQETAVVQSSIVQAVPQPIRTQTVTVVEEKTKKHHHVKEEKKGHHKKQEVIVKEIVKEVPVRYVQSVPVQYVRHVPVSACCGQHHLVRQYVQATPQYYAVPQTVVLQDHAKHSHHHDCKHVQVKQVPVWHTTAPIVPSSPFPVFHPIKALKALFLKHLLTPQVPYSTPCCGK